MYNRPTINIKNHRYCCNLNDETNKTTANIWVCSLQASALLGGVRFTNAAMLGTGILLNMSYRHLKQPPSRSRQQPQSHMAQPAPWRAKTDGSVSDLVGTAANGLDPNRRARANSYVFSSGELLLTEHHAIWPINGPLCLTSPDHAQKKETWPGACWSKQPVHLARFEAKGTSTKEDEVHAGSSGPVPVDFWSRATSALSLLASSWRSTEQTNPYRPVPACSGNLRDNRYTVTSASKDLLSRRRSQLLARRHGLLTRIALPPASWTPL